jgi:hypothetical protein
MQQCIVYTIHILVLVIFKFGKLLNKQSLLEELEIHVCSLAFHCFQDIYLIAPKRHDLLSDRIYQVYTRYIPKRACKPFQLPISAWKFLKGTSVGSSQFWPQRGCLLVAGAVQNSTTRCWSCKYGCPSMRTGEAFKLYTPGLWFRLIPWFQQSSSKVPQRGWRKPSWAESPSLNCWRGQQQYPWEAAYSGRIAGETQNTYCLDQIVLQQSCSCHHALQCRMDEEG